tara:strand:- start:1645 stop:2370 length:726 start_codon:yes stop_codon:yes gene_type:complete
MNIFGILFIVVIIVLLVYLINYLFFQQNKALSKCLPATKRQEIKAKKLKGSHNDNNYAYSIWFYVTDWQYRLTETKDLLVRGSMSGHASPRITLAPYENNLTVSISTVQQKTNEVFNSVAGRPPHTDHKCSIENFPLQRWVNLIVSLNNRTLDLYLDGKLVRTCILPSPAKIHNNAPVLITPGGGFKGYTSNLQFFANPLNPQQSFNIYRAGPNCGSDFFDKYKLKVTYLVDNKEEGEFTI